MTGAIYGVWRKLAEGQPCWDSRDSFDRVRVWGQLEQPFGDTGKVVATSSAEGQLDSGVIARHSGTADIPPFEGTPEKEHGRSGVSVPFSRPTRTGDSAVIDYDCLITWLSERFNALEGRLDALEIEVKSLNAAVCEGRDGADPSASVIVAEPVFNRLPEEQRKVFRDIMALHVTEKGIIRKAERLLRKLADVPVTEALTEGLRLTLRHFRWKVPCPTCGELSTPVWQSGKKYAEGGILKFYHRDKSTGGDAKHAGTTTLPALCPRKVPAGERRVTLR
ncbi:MAG: hypothetical protein HY372_03410 [Candidatus Andersenbacteria bacterium]|nr:hypothetical protein [Candidatus Andersenbacteria bacterium]